VTLVAHADDESVCYGALLSRMREAVVVIATDGAPRDPYFWEHFGSRQAYAAVRRDEAHRAMHLAGVRELVLLAEADSRLEDQRLFLNLAPAYELLEKLAQRICPQAICTLAYEGGHPDHDSCSLLAARLGRQFDVPVWESPVYSRNNPAAQAGCEGNGEAQSCEGQSRQGTPRIQQFLRETGDEVTLEIDPAEFERKCAMCAQYASQGDFLKTFDARREIFRPQVNYDYAKPPHPGPTNYEQWRWWMSAREVSSKFAEFLESKI
jgi:LmbE family N-acetylglucosaminyl deacetylase